jgi:hypothetical protein
MGKAFRSVLLVIFLSILMGGCSGNTAKNIYKDKDKPKPAEKENP